MKHKWLNSILEIPEIQQAGYISHQSITTGSSNKNFKVTTQQGTWVIRFNQATLGINRDEEAQILKRLKPFRLTPEIISINTQQPGYLITNFISKADWKIADFTNPDKIKTLKQALTKFHEIPYTYLPSRLDNRIKHYLKHIKDIPITLKHHLTESINELKRLNFWQNNTSLYHSDLNPCNLLGHDQLYIIDWEYAGQGHPLLDWIIMEHHAEIDLSAHYPEGIQDQWIEPTGQMIKGMMQLWQHKNKSSEQQSNFFKPPIK